METLSQHLRSHAPLIWVVSDEPRRVFEELKTATDREVMRMDLFGPEGNGALERWDRVKNRWLFVINDRPMTADEIAERKALGAGDPVISDFGDALRYATDRQGVFVVENAHFMAERTIPLLSYLSRKWLDAFYADNADAMGPTIVMISCKTDLPPEINRSTVKTVLDLPGAKEMGDIVDYIVSHARTRRPDPNEHRQLVRAAVGLSEFEAINALTESIDDRKRLGYEHVNKRKLRTLAHDGLLEIRPPGLSMNDVGGLDLAKELLRVATWIWAHPDQAAELDLEPLRRIVLVGVQGAGKSLICEAAAQQLGHDLVKFSIGKMMDKFIGESEAKIRRAMSQIRAMAPLTLWMDEFGYDLSGSASSAVTDGGTTARVHGAFLTGLQELPENVFLVAAANRINDLPPEMLRADRMDKVLFVGFPTAEERTAIWRIHLGRQAASHDVNRLATASGFFTGAEIKAVLRETRVMVASRTNPPRSPTTDELIEAMAQMKHRVWVNHRDEITAMYRRALTEWAWASSGQEAEADLVLGDRRVGGGSVKPIGAGAGDLFANVNDL